MPYLIGGAAGSALWLGLYASYEWTTSPWPAAVAINVAANVVNGVASFWHF